MKHGLLLYLYIPFPVAIIGGLVAIVYACFTVTDQGWLLVIIPGIILASCVAVIVLCAWMISFIYFGVTSSIFTLAIAFFAWQAGLELDIVVLLGLLVEQFLPDQITLFSDIGSLIYTLLSLIASHGYKIIYLFR